MMKWKNGTHNTLLGRLARFLTGKHIRPLEDDWSLNENKRAELNSIFGKSHINADKSHTNADLTKQRGYVWEILKEIGLMADNVTLQERGMWWKSNQQVVWKEIQLMRGSKSAGIKKSAFNGK